MRYHAIAFNGVECQNTAEGHDGNPKEGTIEDGYLKYKVFSDF